MSDSPRRRGWEPRERQLPGLRATPPDDSSTASDGRIASPPLNVHGHDCRADRYCHIGPDCRRLVRRDSPPADIHRRAAQDLLARSARARISVSASSRLISLRFHLPNVALSTSSRTCRSSGPARRLPKNLVEVGLDDGDRNLRIEASPVARFVALARPLRPKSSPLARVGVRKCGGQTALHACCLPGEPVPSGNVQITLGMTLAGTHHAKLSPHSPRQSF